MNKQTPTDNKPIITFGTVFLLFCAWVWNLQITFPNQDIWLAFIDISSCFRFPCIMADLCGGFGFLIGPCFFALRQWYLAAWPPPARGNLSDEPSPPLWSLVLRGRGLCKSTSNCLS